MAPGLMRKLAPLLLLLSVGCQRPLPSPATTPDLNWKVRVAGKKIEGGNTKVHWRWTLTGDQPLIATRSDGWRISLMPAEAGQNGSKSWTLDLTVTTDEAPNGLMDVRVDSALRAAGAKPPPASESPAHIRALLAPADRSVSVLADGKREMGISEVLPLIRLNLKASDGAPLGHEVILSIDPSP
ncbi:MAG TPA: hypothetical protein VG406_03280 [Isosphaeraceae bacterium]|nr:hypothetical protein [Isosphaeraceae bacterium]